MIRREADLWAIVRSLGEDHVALLDNPGAPSRLGGMSYLGLFPREQLRIKHGEDPELALANLADFTRPRGIPTVGGAPFASGAIGYISYELLHGIEPSVPASRAVRPPGDLLHFVRFGAVIAVDHVRGTTEVCGRDPKAMMIASDLVRAARNRREIEPPPRPTGDFGIDELRACGLEPVIEPAGYMKLVETAREQIAAGRFFEVCLSQQYLGHTTASGREIYDQLRQINPAPMSSYLNLGELEVLCSSPERLVGLTAVGEIETRPIKGTRPRGATEAEDRHLAEALASSPKDRAENTMIVDLARNDLGRICLTGSVEVPEFCTVESYASVHHLVSTVRGQIAPGVAPADVIRACFPGGSMTGAPKVEAMKAISEAEPSRRGIFSGAIGWIGDDGALDLNIVIRTLVKQGDEITLHTGGAVTADSDPAAEYAETMDKARAPATALAAARAKLAGQSISGA
jgi:anthranilate/para-aminobenzoate synthase component I